MVTLSELKEALAHFHQSFPRPGVPDLLSRLTTISFDYEQDWSRLWLDDGVLRKHADDPCVYFFFNDTEGLMYIGSTWTLGKRFYQHFDVENAKYKNCTSSLAILALPEENWFETQAIEAYLIEKLKPPHNTVGKW